MSPRLRGFLGPLLICTALAALGFATGYMARGLWPPTSDRYALLRESQSLLVDNFFGQLPDEVSMERGMVRGMLQQVGDPYTVYVEPAAHEIETGTLAGEYGGIGAVLSRDQAGKVHLVPFPDGPAARAGVTEGDVLVAVDGQAVGPESRLEDVEAALRGPEGTSVVVTLAPRNPGQRQLHLTITRQVIPLPSVTGYLLPDDPTIGVLVVSVLSEKTPNEIRSSYGDLVRRGAHSMILDLRGNAGGLLESGVDLARFFLASGTVMIEQRRSGPEIVYEILAPGEGSAIPLCVLVDGSTASAAEIVAAALQANQRAPLVGVPTYGKGSVQLIFELRDGSSLHVTNARWLAPYREILDGKGLQPDIVVEAGDGASIADPFLSAAAHWLQDHEETTP